ncbi:MAG: ABC transporter substrate-binding protein [Flavobacteriales bacterium]|nr:ABC transporter substrate-binding protein [Flavobacteriales bacterium]
MRIHFIRLISALVFICWCSCDSPSERTKSDEKYESSILSFNDSIVCMHKNGLEYFKYQIKSKPPSRVVSLTHTAVSMIKALDQLDCVKGITDANYIKDNSTQLKINSKEIIEIGKNGTIDFESILMLDPQLIIVNSFTPMDQIRKIKELGIEYLFFDEHLESHPLGKLDWLELLGKVFNRERMATLMKDSLKKEYMQLLAKPTKNRPVVFAGQYYNGTWFVPSSNSEFASFVTDANAEYFLSEEQATKSIKLSKEEVLMASDSIDIWRVLVHSNDPITLESISSMNNEYALLKNKIKRIIYCNTSNTSIFEKGILEPHIILKDLNCAFHNPELCDSLHYYQVLQ